MWIEKTGFWPRVALNIWKQEKPCRGGAWPVCAQSPPTDPGKYVSMPQLSTRYTYISRIRSLCGDGDTPHLASLACRAAQWTLKIIDLGGHHRINHGQ